MNENVGKIKILWDLLDSAYDTESCKFSTELIERVLELPGSIKFLSDKGLMQQELLAIQTALAKPIVIPYHKGKVYLFDKINLELNNEKKSIKATFKLINLSDFDIHQIESIGRIILYDDYNGLKKIDINTVIDENKSVKWNRSQVEKMNEELSLFKNQRCYIKKIFNDYLTRFEKERAIHNSMLDIPYDSEFMQRIWDEAYDSHHSYGIRDVEYEATRLLDLFNEILPLYKKIEPMKTVTKKS